MILLDTEILAKTNSAVVFRRDDISSADLVGVITYDKFSDENSILGLPEADADVEDYITWKFRSGLVLIGGSDITDIILPDDINGNLGGKYWYIDSPTVKYYVWYNTGTSTDPSITGKVGIQVNINPNDSSTNVAIQTAAALNALPSVFNVTQSANLITIKIVQSGNVEGPCDVNSGILITKRKEGESSYIGVMASNNGLYPITRPPIPDYSVLRNMQFNIMTDYEWRLIQSIFRLIDIVRRRHPNEGRRVLGMGFDGGYEKKFSIEEILDYIYQTVIEINLHNPMTRFWFKFPTFQNAINAVANPYHINQGVPAEWYEMIVKGATIKALIAKQIYEIDTNFTISDQGLSVTYDRDGKLSGVIAALVNEFDAKKKSAKMNNLPHSGSGIGTYFGFGGHPYMQHILGNLTTNGTLGLSSLVPMFRG